MKQIEVTINILELEDTDLLRLKFLLVKQQRFDEAGKVRALQRHIEELKTL